MNGTGKTLPFLAFLIFASIFFPKPRNALNLQVGKILNNRIRNEIPQRLFPYVVIRHQRSSVSLSLDNDNVRNDETFDIIGYDILLIKFSMDV